MNASHETRSDDVAADVLLVEDNSDDAEFTLRVLRKAAGSALRVEIAEDGVVALDHLFHMRNGGQATLPRVVLLDLKLPRVDGLEVLKRVRADPRTAGVPVVVLTSSKEPRDIREAYLRGANSYVVKPVEYAELVAKLVEVARYWLVWNRV